MEAWLLADAERAASFLRVSRSVVPRDVDGLDDPKAALVELANSSRSREIRQDLVPRPGSGREVGPAYVSRLIEFTRATPWGWRPEVAAERSPSLARCLRDLARRASAGF